MFGLVVCSVNHGSRYRCALSMVDLVPTYKTVGYTISSYMIVFVLIVEVILDLKGDERLLH